MQTTGRGNFGSRLGVILASAGSAVGLGNIWRFPTEVGRNGGAAFILVYLCCVFLLALPVMISEFIVGRSSRSNTVGAYRTLAPGKPWVVAGFMGVLGGILVLSFYSVVAGWTLHYTIQSFGLKLMGNQDFGEVFNTFVTNPWKPLVYQFVFLLLTHFVVARGVESGIERFSKVMMPVLLVIILLLSCFSLTLPGARDGLAFLLKPDFSKVTTKVVLSAMGQAFFSLSVGIGCLATYASYFKRETRLVNSALSVCAIDSMVAILSGFIIFPAAFSVAGVQVDSGPGLVYITLPHVFNMVFENIPFIGYLFSGLFYILLLLAALTSTISMHEIATAFFRENYKLSRRVSATVVTLICLLLGTACCLSFGPWSEVKIWGMGFFDLFDFLTAKFMMPLGGILITMFVEWYLDRKLVVDELTNGGTLKVRGLSFLLFLVRWVAPIGVGIVFLNELAG
ncbi:MAG: sodium-dependent transporter [Bacteroidaceae bacterium]|nr:sodium-dependent transporter [Bacteroidaceae bacterium]MBQ5741979.1 sodium-dependent transporter [Bacteroidaceae bacterium]MBR5883934.1 sodium-dependent transporter [Bacteroidaceae bacterium]MEE1214289.1 sodium-dependent transporter [Bacteroidaceae bacterium]